MTREHKLSLILGFSAVVFVGLLVSDHFSKARADKVAGELSSRTPEPATVVADREGSSGPIGSMSPEPTAGPGLLAQAPVMERPVEITMHNPGPGSNLPTAPSSGGSVAMTNMGESPSPLSGAGQQGTQPQSPVPGFVFAPGGVNIPANSTNTTVVPPAPTSPVPGFEVLPVTSGKEVKHPVVRGETAAAIARKYYNDAQLAGKVVEFNKNRLPASGALREGVTLRIPPKDVLLGKARLAPESITANSPTSTSRDTGTTVTTGTRGGNNPSPAAPASTYTVVKGDTLGVIAQKTLGTSKRWKEILNLNRKAIDDPDSLVVGTVLKLPNKN